ncbi:TetR/AcrR family transcriptional regulator [Mycobacterium sp. WMMD1722]|uniref:TetR/AcrR family transcriptional regulator n=1 Tax=Mycobacterium sp. WMMD1722 TaxID=3404117 RepID=UPI003BF56EE5
MPRVDPKARRAARHAHPAVVPAPPSKKPITVERIVEAALDVVATQGYDALTMRSVAAELDTGPASLYAHVVNKADLDELLIGRLCSEVVLPAPDPAGWQAQILDVCAQLRDRYLQFPGISRAALAVASTNLDTLRLAEGMLAILLTGGVAPRAAAWAIDALTLYINAYTLEISLIRSRADKGEDDWVLGREELVRRLEALPAETFPYTRRHAAELTSGADHERFDFTVGLIVADLARG